MNASTITTKSKRLGPVKQVIHKAGEMQVSLKSVRVFYVTQLKFRTLVIQGFLITPCMNTSTITTKSKSLGPVNHATHQAGEMQVSLKSVRVFYVTQLKFRILVIQGFLITPCMNTSTITTKSKSLGPVNHATHQAGEMQVSLKSVRVFYVTQLKFRTVVIQGFLITPCMNTSTIATKSKSLGPVNHATHEAGEMQVSLKSVRVFYVTQLKFRTVVIQGFLITPCMNASTITTKSKSLGPVNQATHKAGEMQVSLKSVRVFYVTQLKFRILVIQGFLITPCMITSTITTKSKSLGTLN